MKSAYFKYILSLLIFGTNGIVASYILLSSQEIVFTRTLIGSLFLIIIYIFGKQKTQFWKNKKSMFFLSLSGISMGASWMFLFEAYNQIGVSLATLAYYCGPVIVMLLSPLVFNEKLSGIKILGFSSVVLGMILVNGSDILTGEISWGLVCGILSALLYATMVIFNKKATGITGLENTIGQLVIAFLTVTVYLMLRGSLSISISRESIIPIIILGFVNTGLACYFYFSSIQKLPVQSVSICGYLDPLSALIFSALFLKEHLSPVQIAGAVLILGGAAFGELYGQRRIRLKRRICPEK
ncbi:MAG: EamA family transporter [Clostridiales bacterium]|jgi:drug/metabolite transporter (DMT)-like permease|nr:EamA family transporter [Clostridiales bacterium]